MRGALKNAVLSLLTGVICAVSQPLLLPFIDPKELIFPETSWIFAWFCLVPLMWSTKKMSPASAARQAFIAGAVYYSIALYWLNVAMTVFGGLHPIVSAIALGLLALFLSLYWAAAFALLRFVRERTAWPETAVLPALWTALELLRNYFLSGFPWANLGYSQYNALPLIQVADIGGVYGVCFLIVTGNCAIFEILLWAGRRRGLPLWQTASAVALTASAAAYGYISIGRADAWTAAAGKLKVAMLQGNIEQGIKNRDHLFKNQIVSRYNDLVGEALSGGANLLIWPEAAYPGSVWRDMPDLGALSPAPAKADVFQLIGVATWFRQGDEMLQTNGAFLVDPRQKVTGRYDKSHLVPFGEYVPFADYLPIKRFVSGIGTYVPGKDMRPLSMPGASFGVLICYEGIFPEISRLLARNGAQFLVNVTNDAWYGVSSAPFQHLYMYVFRAVENRRSVARAANTGISALIDPAGRVTTRTGMFEAGFLGGEVALAEKGTLYGLLGDAFAYLCAAFMTGCIAATVFRKKTGKCSPQRAQRAPR